MRRLGLLVAVFLLAGATTAGATHTANPTSVTIAGSLQSELGCAGDWDPDCAATHLDLRRGRRRLAGHVRRSRPATGSTRPRSTTRGTRTTACTRSPDGANIPLNLGVGDDRQVLLRPQDATGSPTTSSSVIAIAPGQLPVASSAAPATGSPTACARGSRTPTATATTRFETTAHPGRHYEAQGRAQRELGRELRPGRRPERRRTSPSPSRPTARRSRSRYDSATHVLTIQRRPRPRQQRRVGRPPPRLARHALPHARRRGPGRHAGHAPLPHLPRRRHRREAARLRRRTRRRSSIVDDDAGGRATSRATRPPRGRDAATSGRRRVTTRDAGQPLVPLHRHRRHDTAYYADDTPALDGGLGAPTDDAVDQSYALTVYAPGFTAPDWAKDAVIYQIFPDRFRNGDTKNDPKTGDVRYDDPVLAAAVEHAARGLLPQLRRRATRLPVALRPAPARVQPDHGAARAAATTWAATSRASTSSSTTCRRSASTRSTSTRSSTPESNHRYDTAGLHEGRSRTSARRRTSRTSSSEARQARDPHHPRRRLQPHVVGQPVLRPLPPLQRRSGACESATSPYRSWFTFHDARNVRRAAAARDYDGWFGFDTIPVLHKAQPGRPGATSSPATNSDRASSWLKAGAGRLAARRDGRPVVPGRLLGARSARSSRRPTRTR